MSALTFRIKLTESLWVVLFAWLLLLLPTSATADVCWADYVIEESGNREEFLLSISEVALFGVAVAKQTEVFEHIDEPSAKVTVAEISTFVVVDAIKGDFSKGANVVVHGSKTNCSCIGDFALGAKYLIYGVIDDSTGKFTLRYCSFIRRIKETEHE